MSFLSGCSKYCHCSCLEPQIVWTVILLSGFSKKPMFVIFVSLPLNNTEVMQVTLLRRTVLEVGYYETVCHSGTCLDG